MEERLRGLETEINELKGEIFRLHSIIGELRKDFMTASERIDTQISLKVNSNDILKTIERARRVKRR
jgi:archaellum component FlaC